MKLGKKSKRARRRADKARNHDRRKRNLERQLGLCASPGVNAELGS